MPLHAYELRFAGEADATVRAAFPEFDVTIANGTSVLRKSQLDQAALHDVLNRIQDLGLVLLDLHTVDEPTEGAGSPAAG